MTSFQGFPEESFGNLGVSPRTSHFEVTQFERVIIDHGESFVVSKLPAATCPYGWLTFFAAKPRWFGKIFNFHPAISDKNDGINDGIQLGAYLNELQLVREINQIDPTFFNILITARGNMDMANEAMTLGVHHSLMKSFNTDAIELAANVLIRRIRTCCQTLFCELSKIG